MGSATGDPFLRSQPAEISRFSVGTFADHVLCIFDDKCDDMKTFDSFSLNQVGT